jgi:hypothetical protein
MSINTCFEPNAPAKCEMYFYSIVTLWLKESVVSVETALNNVIVLATHMNCEMRSFGRHAIN